MATTVVAAPSVDQLPGFDSKIEAFSYLRGFVTPGDRVVVHLKRKREPFAIVAFATARRRGWRVVRDLAKVPA